MRLKRLKVVRVVVSVVLFVLVAAVFLDFRHTLMPAISGMVLYLQFVPSLFSFVHTATLGAAGFVVVLLVTAGVGRVYCSTVCPLGTLQDIFRYAAVRGRASRGFRFHRPSTLLRYAVFLLTLMLLLVVGNGLLVHLLDPFSSSGRIFTNLFRPLVLAANNAGAALLEPHGTYTLSREQWIAVAPFSIGVATATLLLLLLLAARRGRLYCNTLCPVGTLLGLVAKQALFPVTIDIDACTGCGRCASLCKAECIDTVHSTVDMSRCVGCCNCISVCATEAIGFAPRWRSRRFMQPADRGRRNFLAYSGGCLLGTAAIVEARAPGAAVVQSKPTTVPVVRTNPITPPGSGGTDRFFATCTACHLCVSACPTQVLLPSLLEYGLSGLMLPRMNYRGGHCTYECTRCTQICPTGALRALGMEAKKLTQIGVVRFIRENCVVYTDNTACGACSEHCPTKAVTLAPYANPLNKPLGIPEITAELCIGCGGCEHACPTKPYKAIFVDGNPVHKVAKKPIVQQVDAEVDHSGDFPF